MENHTEKAFVPLFKKSLEEYGYWPSCKSWPWFLLLLFISSFLLSLALFLSDGVQDASQHTAGTVSSLLCPGPQLSNLHPKLFLGWSFTVTCKMLTGSQILFKSKIKERQINTHSDYFRESFIAKNNTSPWCILLCFSRVICLAFAETTGWHWDLNSDSLLFLLLWMLMLLFHNSWVRSRWTCEVIFSLKKKHQLNPLTLLYSWEVASGISWHGRL